MKSKIDENLYLAGLIYKHLIGRLHPKGEKMLAKWAASSPANRHLLDSFEKKTDFLRQWKQFNDIDREDGWKKLQEKVPRLRMMAYDGTYLGPGAIAAGGHPHSHPFLRTALMSGVFSLCSLLALFTYNHRQWLLKDGLELGYQKTYLKAEDGPAISLQDRPLGSVIQEGTLDLTLVGQRLLSLQMKTFQPGTTDSRLTFYTANGGKCSIAMPDGSRVHLNAASYIRFATYYGRQRREMNLRGEGYFEIKTIHAAAAHQPKIPFVVHVMLPPSMQTHNTDSSLLTITATGTVFNIKAYDSSGVQTTLVSGTLDVQRTGDTAISHLTKGDSYVLNRDGSFHIQPSDLRSAIGWKDGEFIFENRPIDEILQELARAYDVKVQYQDTPGGTFNLRGTRAESLKDILDRIDGSNNVHFTIGDSRIIVTVTH